MLSTAKLLTYNLILQDRQVAGKFSDVLIDSRDWAIKFLLFRRHGARADEQLLIHQQSIKQHNREKQEVTLDVPAALLDQGPYVQASVPLSRQIISSLLRFPGYLLLTGNETGQIPVWLKTTLERLEIRGRKSGYAVQSESRLPETLLSFEQLRDCPVEARDGRAGHFADLMMEPDFSRPRSALIRVPKWLPGTTMVMISTDDIIVNRAQEDCIGVDLSRQQFDQRPAYSSF